MIDPRYAQFGGSVRCAVSVRERNTELRSRVGERREGERKKRGGREGAGVGDEDECAGAGDDERWGGRGDETG
jgi:hypothetical protein